MESLLNVVYLCYRAKEEILSCILDLTELPKVQGAREWEETLKAMLKYPDIWPIVLGSLNDQTHLNAHPELCAALKALGWLKEVVNNCHIRVGFLLESTPDERALLGTFCALIEPELKLENSQSIQKEWVTTIEATREKALNAANTFKKLESTINFLKTVARDIVGVADLTDIIQEVNERKKNIKDTILSETTNDDHWGPLLPLIKLGKDLSALEASVVFKNVAHCCLVEEHPVCADTTKNGLSSTTVEKIMVLLSSKGVPRFQSTSMQLFQGCSDLLVRDVEILFNGITEESHLKTELTIISEFVKRDYPPCGKMIANYLKYPILQRKAQQLISAIRIFGDNSPKECSVTKELKQFALCSQLKGYTLAQLSRTVESSKLSRLDQVFDEDMSDIVAILSCSSDLLEFMKDTAKEDIIVLIDAVEEHSDHFVSESVVSDLIDVHTFLRNILMNMPKDPWDLADGLRKSYDDLNQSRKRGMAAKIKACSYNVHSLRGLYLNRVANREEMTREKISNALSKGCYQLRLKPSGWEVILSYHRQDESDKVTSYSLAELLDLRSRALLIMNTDKKQRTLGDKDEAKGSEKTTKEEQDTQFSSVDLSEFVVQVDHISEILRMCEQLHSSGHPDFKEFWTKLQSSKDIQSLASNLKKKVKKWETILDTVRKEYFYLNYFHTDQLWVLSEFFARGHAVDKYPSLKRAALDLLRFIDTSIRLEDVVSFVASHKRPKMKGNHEGNLRSVGQTLNDLFKPWKIASPPTKCSPELEAAVKPKELFLAVLEERSSQTVHVVMSLFEHTTGNVPQPSQVLFCHSETSWEEVERLLRRAFMVENQPNSRSLHCLANVECLPNDMQFDLVAAIKKFQSNTESPYLLSLVCRGRPDHPIVDQFSAGVHHIGGMTEAKLKERLSSLCPDVAVVTSDLPGLGKTELIYECAASKKKSVATFPISGPLSRKNLVKRLSALDVSRFKCLHFEIGEVDDPLGLDIFLFELVGLGLVTSGTQLFHIPTKCVYIEITNTLNHWLRDSLPVTKSFTRRDIEWQDYKNYLISQEISSPVQVVCHYLQAHENGSLESKDLIFTGPNKLQPLPPASCKRLLAKFVSSTGDLSFNVIESFINVFAYQLLKFSASPFFKPHHLKAMIGGEHDVRNRLFNALFEVSWEFASRSVITCKAVQLEAISAEQATETLRSIQLGPSKTADHMVKRVQNMTQWADNNHLLVVFYSLEALSLSVTALYRDVHVVPTSIKELFKSQEDIGHKGKGLEDFTTMTQEELQLRLDRIACTRPRTEDLTSLGYALTPDNILKMALIIQRIRACIPVIVMGETGCGKTSLVRYLARTCGVPFHVFNFHAGIKEQQIIDFIQEMNEKAEKLHGSGQDIWVFLDEINTCDYLGTINEIMCHRSIQGRPLSPNLVFIAACNPYRIRKSGSMTTAGLSGKAKAEDECSKLVYRVHPLPETMIDYIWDYGSLSPSDERAYIGRMVEGLYKNKYKSLLVNLLSSSQEYIRNVDESSCCVSLRDVHRCTVLMKWFHKSLQERKGLPKQTPQVHLKPYYEMSSRYGEDIRSVILALGHCYQSRLPTANSRQNYRMKVASAFSKQFKGFKESHFEAVVRVEQEEYLARMELPEGTAINAALRENVFVMLVCILNHIPVFVVGKPGCSKSLSMQVIRSNLRGKDAKDPFLKTLPKLYVVSFQGSKSSTSEGIVKVFEKARKYKSYNKTDDVLPVVLLDEIGLAEDSKHNPLKVLHSLLEPGDGDFPDVAVVGISNWALDPAKMNRANHLSRPEPDVEDLFDTGLSIRGAHFKVGTTRSERKYQTPTNLSDEQLRCLAEAYYEYQEGQERHNFHGLRDYYSLIKNLSAPAENNNFWDETGGKTASAIHRALQRNFGGLDDICKIQRLFVEKIKAHDVVQDYHPVIVTDLIRDNLYDRNARHLMLITSGDSAIGILDQTLQSLDKEKITIFGSRLEEDLSEDYSYRILSRIILCMERDCVLILRDLENIYGSLYDMLNQNYTVVGGKKNCRVALGPFSNPMCQVHDGFRCIVLKDHQMIAKADPPFLNRFEKQILRFSDVLDPEQHKMIEYLQTWVTNISTSTNLVPTQVASNFTEQDMFVGFHDDTLSSLVLHHSQGTETDSEHLIERCKEDLMWIASPEGVLRSLKSRQAEMEVDEVTRLYHSYFEKPIHNGIRHFLSEGDDIGVKDDMIGVKLLIMTHSNIHTNVIDCLDRLMECQAKKLSSFKSEKQLTKQLKQFWKDPETELLVLQCKPDLDATHMLLAKSIIEQQRAEFVSATAESKPHSKKHVCIIVHEQRVKKECEVDESNWQFNFLSGWRQITVDVLEKPILPITSLLDVGLVDLLNTSSLPFESIASDELLWCFMQIKYQVAQQSQLTDTILQLVQNVRSSPKIMECFKELTSRWIEERLNQEVHDDFLESLGTSVWQISVAFDRQALLSSSTLTGAMQRYVSHLVRRPLARIIYFLESESAWLGNIRRGGTEADEEDLQVWLDLLLDKSIFDIDEIPEPQGAESYLVSSQFPTLQYPFSNVFIEKVESTKEIFLEDLRELQLYEDKVDENGELVAREMEWLLQRFSSVIEQKIPQILDSDSLMEKVQIYVEDLLDIKSAEVSLPRQQRVAFLKAACADHIKISGCGGNVALLFAQLHSIFWMEGEALSSAIHLFVASQAISINMDEIIDEFMASFETKVTQDTSHEELEEIPSVTYSKGEERLNETEEEVAVQDEPDSRERSASGDGSTESSTTEVQRPADHTTRETVKGAEATDETGMVNIQTGEDQELRFSKEDQMTKATGTPGKETIDMIDKTSEGTEDDLDTIDKSKDKVRPEDGAEVNTEGGGSQTTGVAITKEPLAEVDERGEVALPVAGAEEEQKAGQAKDLIVSEEDTGAVRRTEGEGQTISVELSEEESTVDVSESEGGETKDMPLLEAGTGEVLEAKPDLRGSQAKDMAFIEEVSKDDVQTELEDGQRKIARTEKKPVPQLGTAGELENERQTDAMTLQEEGSENDVEADPADGQTEGVRTESGAEAETGEIQAENVPLPEETSQLCFEEALIDAICVATFPTQPAVENLGGISGWSQTASLLLSMMSKMSSEVLALHYLRVCYDYASLVVVPESLEPFSLYELGSLGSLIAVEDELYLDSQECFNHISELVKNQLENGKSHEKLQEFLILFFSRCVESNPDTPVRGSILDTISTTTNKTMLKFVGPVIHFLLWTEEETSPGAFENVLANPDALDEYPGLQDMSAALDAEIKLDLPFVVMCCDLIGEVAFQGIDLTTVSGSEDRLLVNLRTATKIVTDSSEDENVFRLLCAVAYLRSVLSSVARLVRDNPAYLLQDGEFTMLLNDVSAAITANESSPAYPRKAAIRMFLLKELRKKMPLYDLRNLCKGSVKLPALEKVQWQDDSAEKSSFGPFEELSQNTPAEDALAKLLAVKRDEVPITNYLKTLKETSVSKLQLAAVLIKAFYLIRSIRNLKDTEDKAADCIMKGLEGLPKHYRNLVSHTLGKEDFKARELNISPESSVRHVHRTVLVLHLAAILASSGNSPTSPFLLYFMNPLNSKGKFVLTAPDDIGTGYQTFCNYLAQTSTDVRICLCSCSVAFPNAVDDQNMICSSCQSDFKTEALDQLSHVEAHISASKGYVPQRMEDMKEDFLCVRQLGPVEFRMLHLLVHVALYVGYALQLFEDAALRKFLSHTTEHEEASKVCFEHIENDLQVLCNLLNVGEEDALHLMHCVLEVTTLLLTQSVQLTSEANRSSWEKRFADAVAPLFQESKTTKWKLNIDQSCKVISPSVEQQLGANHIPEDAQSRNKHMACLFRATQPKTFISLRAFYMNASDQVQKQHPLLGLFLDHRHTLPLIAHLHNLLNWSRIVESRLRRRLSRKDARLNIGDVIRGEYGGSKESSDKKSWKNVFDDFKKSWEEVRPLVMKELGPDKEVPHLSETSPIACCLVERRYDGVFLCTALELLQTLQNQFLEKVLAISSSGACAALNFLQREDRSAIHVVHLQDARKKEIIHYQWSDEILRNSQRDTEYGRGHNIFYDLGMVEKELAVRFLLGKAYLSTHGGLREFIFSKELFHTCGNILQDLQQIIPQECLTHEMKRGLWNVKDHSLKNAQDLLEHLEIVLCVLKRIGGTPNQPLVAFTDQWLSTQSRPFPKSLIPEPHTAIQLKHVVSLYEFFEDVFAESSAESVPDMYREALIEDVKDQMAKAVSNLENAGDAISLDAVITSLQRFMFRYLSSEDRRPDPGGDLSECMTEPSLWPMGYFKKGTPQQLVRQVVPSSLTIGQVHSVLLFYQELSKVSY